MQDNKRNNRPLPTFAFVILIILCIGCLVGGSITMYYFLSFKEDRIIPLIIFSVICFIISIVIFIKIIKQIILRLTWDEANDVEASTRDITTEEANMYQAMTGNPDFHNEEIDKAMGINYNPKLKTDKYGNTYFTSTTTYDTNLTGKKNIIMIIRIIIWLILLTFIAFLTIGFIMQETNNPMSDKFLKLAVKILLGALFGAVGIGIVASIYIGIGIWIKILKGKDS